MTIEAGQPITAGDFLAALALKLPAVGGTMSGPILLAADPTDPLQAATKQYIDAINTTLTDALAAVVPAGALLKAGGTMTGDLTLAADPTTALQAATKQYADAVIATVATAAATAQTAADAALPKAGGTATGPVVLAGNPTSALAAAPKQYVDAVNTALSALVTAAQTAASAALPRSGGTMTGALVLAGNPAAALQAAAKQYVDASIAAATAAIAAAQATASGALPTAGGTMAGALVLSGNPIVPLGAATKQYADNPPLIVSNIYTASGPIAPSDTFAVIEAATPLALTLAAGTNGHALVIDNVGPATVTVTATMQLVAGETYSLPRDTVLALVYSTTVTPASWLLTSVAPRTTATAISVDALPQSLPNTALTVTGTLQGLSSALQFQIDAGSWTAATGATISPNAGFSFVIPGGIAAEGSHTVSVRDANAISVAATSPPFVVAAFNPATVSTGTAVWVFDANDPALVAANASTTVVTSVANRLAPSQTLKVFSGASNTPVLWQRGLGTDGKRRLLKMSPAIGDGIDPNANWFSAGGLSGPCAAMITALNMPSGVNKGAFTVGWAGYCDFSTAGYDYWCAPIWINCALYGGADQWLMIRWNGSVGNVNGQISDPGGTNSNAPVATPSSGDYVWVFVKNGAALSLRMNGVEVGTATVTSTATFTAGDFRFGGGGGAGGSPPSGQPPTSWGALQVYQGALSGADLAGMEAMLASAVALTIATGGTTYATAISVDAPAQALPNTTLTITGPVQGTPTALEYSVSGGSWTTATSPAIVANTSFSFSIAAGLAAGSYTIAVRDANATSVSGTSGTFVVSAFNPATVSGGPAVWVFDPNDPALVTLDGSGAVATIANRMDTSQKLNAVSGSNGNKVIWQRGAGADGQRRLLKMRPTTIDNSVNDPATNWFSAGGTSGSAAALVSALNTSNVSTGSWTICFAAYLDTSGTYTFLGGPIWGVSGQAQRVMGGRWAGYAGNVSSIVSGTDGTGYAAASTAPGSEWSVITFRKSGTDLTQLINGVHTAAATIASTSSFTAANFMLGSGMVDGNGYPYPWFGALQVYPAALVDADRIGMEQMVGNSIGLAL